MFVPVAVWQPCELLYTCYLLTYLLTCFTLTTDINRIAAVPTISGKSGPALGGTE